MRPRGSRSPRARERANDVGTGVSPVALQGKWESVLAMEIVVGPSIPSAVRVGADLLANKERAR